MKKLVFVAQPFDGGKYDERYNDSYKPAIESAGFEPYRVDRDPSASIPIDEIEKKINESYLVFSDITLDNPNVWFEVGYSIAKDKEVCFVCAEERLKDKKKFPFDVQHRNIIVYSGESKSSWEKLERDIRERIKGIEENIQRKNEIELKIKNRISHDEAKDDSLPEMEITALAIIASHNSPFDGISLYSFGQTMEKNGYNNIGSNVSFKNLARKEIICVEDDYDPEFKEHFKVLKVTDLGWDFINKNIGHFRTTKVTSRKSDDEIPF